MFKHSKRNNWLKVVGVVSLIIIIFGSGATLYVRRWYSTALKPVSSTSEVVLVKIESGSSPKDIALLLESKGLIRSANAFETYVRGSGDASKLKAGTFELSASMSTQEVANVLVEGKVTSSLFTIAPGLRVDQIRKRLIDAGYPESDIDAALETSQYNDIAIVRTIKPGSSLEGYIYPESFRIDTSTTPQQIIRQSLIELDKVITPQMMAGFEEQGLSVYDAITLASIVEKEVPSTEDRKIVAQIFLKRLKEGISLGSDATYYYASAVFGGEPFPTLDSPYNTRIYAGLPPGPINNMSSVSLDAIAEPANTNYLFFVTGDDGYNHFTSTEAEHLAAVSQYCKISCAPGYIPDR